jgi:outer membrane protein assembly factor BamE (lipoprotein component of BamABCDE complex)
MMKSTVFFVLTLATLTVSACSEGVMGKDGRIGPCTGYHTDKQACGNAKYNAPLLSKIHSGMTQEEVRAVMGHDPERRQITDGAESWLYMSDYQAELMTAITFTDGKVTGMKQVPWRAK